MSDALERAAWVGLCQTGLVGGATLRRLLERFGTALGALSASPAELRALPRGGPALARAIHNVEPARQLQEMAAWAAEGINIVTWLDAVYPAALRAAADAPPVLFVRGTLRPGDRAALALVGTRAASAAGQRQAERCASILAERGITVVSGLALGIDAVAHGGALAAGGRTLAVLGSGLRCIYPRQHAGLAERVEAQGALCSERHPDAGAGRAALVARDRIISGLCYGILVVESGVEGGSMRTAAFAQRQGRWVGAVPGSPGTERLLAAGAAAMDAQGDWDALAERIHAWLPASCTPVVQPRLLEAGPVYPAG